MQYRLLQGLKQNVEALVGARGDTTGQAVLRGQINVDQMQPLSAKQVSVSNSAISVSGQAVPTYSDFASAIADLQKMRADMETMRQTLNALISQLRG
jgi:hypothetical protein